MTIEHSRRSLGRVLFLSLALPTFTAFPAFPVRAGLFSSEETFDVVVVGGGGAGLAAAAAAAEAGASILVLEKLRALGGNTVRASGLFNAADPERQRAQGIEDSIDWHYEQTLVSGGGRSSPALVRRFAEDALPTLHWLEGLGVRFLPETYATWGAEWPRGHKPVLPRGTAYIRALSGRIAALGGEIRTNAPVTALIRSEGRIAGVVAEIEGRSRRILARCGVVLAAGGYGASPLRLAEWAPGTETLPTDNSPGNTGEVILEAHRAGAALTNLDCVQMVPGAPAGRDFQVRLDLDAGRSILVDGTGRRLADEVDSRRGLAQAIRAAAGGRAFMLADNAAVESYDLPSRKSIYRGLATGDAVREQSIAALAQRIGVDAATLEASVAAFNAETVARTGKCAKTVCRPIETAPFWASPVVLNLHSTMGGVVVDAEARVLDEAGRPIPGLRAAGEIVGNLHGVNRIGGNGIAAAIVLGRIAGKSLAERH